ncbi:MAG: LacI family DNA-binding transcriptional regulator [Beutenbergiaceae bacterium]
MDVTARDVARAAGVSESTVSRALAHSNAVAPSTRNKVHRIAQELGYTARAGASPARTGSIGVVVPDLANPFFAGLSKSLRAAASGSGLRTMIVDSDEDLRHERDAASYLATQVDALVLCSPRCPDDELKGLVGKVPTVLTSRVVEGVPTIRIDESYSVGRVLAHLRALGHQRIAYVGGPAASTSEIARSAGLVEAVAVASDLDVIRVTNVTPSVIGGMGAADEVLASGASAVITFNDMVALGLVAHALRRGTRIPEDLSVVGFDDVLIAEAAHPQLTTVAMPLRAVGSSAIRLLLEWLDTGTTPATPDPVRGELVVRHSTAPAPRS